MPTQKQQSGNTLRQTWSDWRKTFMRKSGVMLFVIALLFATLGPSLSQLAENGMWTTSVYAQEEGASCELEGVNGATIQGGECKPPPSNNEPSEIAQSFSQLASFVNHIFVAIVSFEAVLIGELMGNELIMGDAGDDDPDSVDIANLLNNFWRIMRDLVNYAFIIVLLVIAFMTVITAGGGVMGAGDGFKVGQILPKFVIAVVLVNFTWFGARVVLDAANVAAHVVYAIPASMPDYGFELIEDCEPPPCLGGDDVLPPNTRRCVYEVKRLNFSQSAGTPTPDAAGGALAAAGANTCANGVFTIEFYEDPIDWDMVSRNNIATLFAFGLLDVHQLVLTNSAVDNLMDLSLNTIFVFLLMIILIVVFSAMMLVLLERVIMLWIHIVLSPLLVLLWVVKDAIGSGEGSMDKISFSSFIGYAFLPAMMGFPLVLGMMMVIVGGQVDLTEVFTTEVNGIEMITGLPGIDNLQQFLWYIIAIAILWQTMTIAQKMDGFTKGTIESMKGGVEGLGAFIAKSPMYLPWIPVRSGVSDTTAPMDHFTGLRNIGANIRNASAERARSLYGGPNLSAEQQSAISSTDIDTIRTIINDLNQRGTGAYNRENFIGHGMDADKATQIFSRTDNQRDVVSELARRVPGATATSKALGTDTDSPPSSPATQNIIVNLPAIGSRRPMNFNISTSATGSTPAELANNIMEAFKQNRDGEEKLDMTTLQAIFDYSNIASVHPSVSVQQIANILSENENWHSPTE